MKTLQAVILAATGKHVDPLVIADALEAHAPRGLVMARHDVESLVSRVRQKRLMDRAARLSMRAFGGREPMITGHEIYAAQAEAQGIEPYALKTYKNRALAQFERRKP